MKKTLLLVGLLTTSICATAQTTVTFDDLTLDTMVYWSGSDGSGSFSSAGVTFPNDYQGYWAGGFIYSRSTDVTTAGYLNDFSAYTGIGASNSSNYGVSNSYSGSSIDFGEETELTSITLTNATYAALSMLNGDFFGKVFGSVNNAQGNPDGTNGEDYFRLLITGIDINGDTTDQVIFYLADYRFADSTQDYIVDTWETIDLTSLGTIRYLEFTLESSDTGPNGMNTPAYFALDNLVYSSVAGVSELPSQTLKVYPNPATAIVHISGLNGEITVRQADGKLVYAGAINGLTTLSTENWSAGYYQIEVNGQSGVCRSTFIKQ